MGNGNDPHKVTFTVGTNFDPALIEVIDRHNADGAFKTIFGKLRSDWFGGGRASMLLPEVSMAELQVHVDAAHGKHLGFSYLMNPWCLGNKEVDPDQHREMLRWIDRVVATGVDSITLNSPLLCSILKRRHPRLEIVVGLYASVYTPKQLVDWKELGADVITLVQQVNRDFGRLERLLTVAKELDLGLRLLANNFCVFDCAYAMYHGSELSHASQVGEKGSDFVLDCALMQCTRAKIADPEKLLASAWIRPEDLIHYEDLCRRTGFPGLGIKLVDRIKSTPAIARVVKAYAERSYDGNLLDILTSPREAAIKRTQQEGIAWTSKYGFNPMEMRKLGRFYSLPSVVIDNKKLDGFLDRFVSGGSCANLTCAGSASSAEGSAGNCSYCKQWAAKAVCSDASETQEWIANADDLLQSIQTSKLFGAERRRE